MFCCLFSSTPVPIGRLDAFHKRTYSKDLCYSQAYSFTYGGVYEIRNYGYRKFIPVASGPHRKDRSPPPGDGTLGRREWEEEERSSDPHPVDPWGKFYWLTDNQ